MSTPGWLLHVDRSTSAPGWILHVDLDQFIAAVEVLRRPELRGRPVIVGGSGDPTQRRMVVATASYEARAFGVHSGMPLRAAYKRCPEAVFLPSDRAAYEVASAQVMATLRSFPVVVEVWGWDEAFVGARTHDPEQLASDIRRAVLDATQLSCSIGIGDTKQRAKIATGFAKPAGVYRLTADTWLPLMGERSTDALWGVGKKTAASLAALGLHTIADLVNADVNELAARFGPRTGPWLQELGRGGGDTAVVDEPWVARSRSRETTYPEDITQRAEIERQIGVLTAGLVRDVVADGRVVTRVALKVRYASFFTRTSIAKLPAPTTEAAEVERVALQVLERFDLDRPVRLLGVRVELAPLDAKPSRRHETP